LVNVYSRTNTGSGFHQTGRSDTRYIGCIARYNNEYGFRATFDTTYTGCFAGFNGVAGWYGASSSVRFAACKAYNNGIAKAWVSGTQYFVGELVIHVGILYFVKITNSSVTAPASDGTNYAAFTVEDLTGFGSGYHWTFGSTLSWSACEAQQNAGSGWHLKNTNGAVIQGFVGGTNMIDAGAVVAATNPNNYSALVLEGATATIADIGYAGFGGTAFALRIKDGTGASDRNTIRMTGDESEDAALAADSVALAGTNNLFLLNDVQENPMVLKAGAPADGDFSRTPPNGTLALDTTNNRLYVRDGGTWRYAALT
jgi:hypothetical protein